MLSPRVQKALWLIGSASVQERGDGRYEVISWNSPPTRYQVRENYCNCPDFAYRGAEPCAHLLAVRMISGIRSITW
jgi:predicted nucleic acid-binding Zn finger protein